MALVFVGESVIFPRASPGQKLAFECSFLKQFLLVLSIIYISIPTVFCCNLLCVVLRFPKNVSEAKIRTSVKHSYLWESKGETVGDLNLRIVSTGGAL